jgi:hypothetical protein
MNRSQDEIVAITRTMYDRAGCRHQAGGGLLVSSGRPNLRRGDRVRAPLRRRDHKD